MKVHIGCVVRGEQTWLETEKRQNVQPESLRLVEAGIVGQPGIPLNPPDNNISSQPRLPFLPAIAFSQALVCRHAYEDSATVQGCFGESLCRKDQSSAYCHVYASDFAELFKAVCPVVPWSLMTAILDAFRRRQGRPRAHKSRSSWSRCSRIASAALKPARNAPSTRPPASQSPHTASPNPGSKSIRRSSGSEH